MCARLHSRCVCLQRSAEVKTHHLQVGGAVPQLHGCGVLQALSDSRTALTPHPLQSLRGCLRCGERSASCIHPSVLSRCAVRPNPSVVLHAGQPVSGAAAAAAQRSAAACSAWHALHSPPAAEGCPNLQVIVAAPQELIKLAFEALLQPGDHVVSIFPAYQALYELARHAGCTVSLWEATAQPDGSYAFDVRPFCCGHTC